MLLCLGYPGYPGPMGVPGPKGEKGECQGKHNGQHRTKQFYKVYRTKNMEAHFKSELHFYFQIFPEKKLHVHCTQFIYLVYPTLLKNPFSTVHINKKKYFRHADFLYI